MTLHQRVTDEFAKHFGGHPGVVVRAPGRVNLIGEHTDYNDGFVLPMAIDRALWIALRRRDDGQVSAVSLDFDEKSSFSLDGLDHEAPSWVEYVKGMAWALQESGLRLNGWEGVIAGDVPLGAGLSSSAALELATARAFSAVSGFAWNAKRMALLGQRAENDWVGMNCGIMDQMISAAGQKGHALLIDCRSLETEAVPLPAGMAVVVLDTMTRRGLVDSAYNERRVQCEAAASFFGVEALRDVTLARFEAEGGELDDVTLRRARHVITENKRTSRASAAMQRGDAAEVGWLMNESHASMRDDFEISCAELNAMVACARQQDGCYGARMTGGGFGGCAVAVVREGVADRFSRVVAACYEKKTGLVPNTYVCQATDGASVV
jgi:galactokinase